MSSGERSALDWRAVLREPLVHFVVLGGLVFVAHALLATTPDTDERRLILTPSVRSALAREFVGKYGRDPTPDDERELVDTWISEEVLLQEGLRLGLDRGDLVVRDRVISKMRSVLEGLVIVRQPTDAELGQLLATHRARYERPVRYNLEHAFADKRHRDARARAERYRAELTAGAEREGLGDPFALGTRHERRSSEYLTRSFGRQFADQVRSAEPGRWYTVESDHGWHAVRVTERAGGQPSTVESERAKLVRDWQNSEKDRIVRDKIAELVRSYELRTDR
jgi:hypothetical protein